MGESLQSLLIKCLDHWATRMILNIEKGRMAIKANWLSWQVKAIHIQTQGQTAGKGIQNWKSSILKSSIQKTIQVTYWANICISGFWPHSRRDWDRWKHLKTRAEVWLYHGITIFFNPEHISEAYFKNKQTTYNPEKQFRLWLNSI